MNEDNVRYLPVRAPEEPLRAPQGIAWAILLSLPIWAVIVVVVAHFI